MKSTKTYQSKLFVCSQYIPVSSTARVMSLKSPQDREENGLVKLKWPDQYQVDQAPKITPSRIFEKKQVNSAQNFSLYLMFLQMDKISMTFPCS